MSSSSDQDAGSVPVKALPHRETCCSLSISDHVAGRGPTSLFVCARIFVSEGWFLQALGKVPPRRLLSRYLGVRTGDTPGCHAAGGRRRAEERSDGKKPRSDSRAGRAQIEGFAEDPEARPFVWQRPREAV